MRLSSYIAAVTSAATEASVVRSAKRRTKPFLYMWTLPRVIMFVVIVGICIYYSLLYTGTISHKRSEDGDPDTLGMAIAYGLLSLWMLYWYRYNRLIPSCLTRRR